MTTTALWVGIGAIIAIYTSAALIFVIFIPRLQYPKRFFKDANLRLQYEDARNKARQTVVQLTLGGGFVFTFVAAIIGQTNAIAENEAKRRKDAIDVYVASRDVQSLAARAVLLDRLAHSDPSGFHDIAYTEIAQNIRSANASRCTNGEAEGIDTRTALLLLAGRRIEDDRVFYLLLEGKCLSGIRMDRLGDKSSFGNGLVNANFSGSEMYASDFSGLNLSGSYFIGIKAGDFDIPGWTLESKNNNLQKRDLNGVPLNRHLRRIYLLHFVGSNLTGAHFDGANISGSDFSDANLTDASFYQSNISRSDFRGSNITIRQLEAACYGYDMNSALENEKAIPILNDDINKKFINGDFKITLCRSGISNNN